MRKGTPEPAPVIHSAAIRERNDVKRRLTVLRGEYASGRARPDDFSVQHKGGALK
jgi:hypothetical protein